MINDEYAAQQPPESQVEPPIKNDELEFTYNLGEMGIQIPYREREIQEQNDKQKDKEFEEIKQRLEEKTATQPTPPIKV